MKESYLTPLLLPLERPTHPHHPPVLPSLAAALSFPPHRPVPLGNSLCSPHDVCPNPLHLLMLFSQTEMYFSFFFYSLFKFHPEEQCLHETFLHILFFLLNHICVKPSYIFYSVSFHGILVTF